MKSVRALVTTVNTLSSEQVMRQVRQTHNVRARECYHDIAPCSHEKQFTRYLTFVMMGGG